MNVLVTSISKKVPMLQMVKTSLTKFSDNSKLYGADANENVIGRFFVDHFWQMPPHDSLELETLISYCLSHRIEAIIPTRDGELLFFAQHKKRLAEENIFVMVSSLDAVKMCIDKFLFYVTGKKRGYPVIQTSLEHIDISSSEFVVKERFGAGADKIGIQLTADEVVAYGKRLFLPIYQPYIKGEEYSVDLYITQNNVVKGAIARKREFVQHGESQITTAVPYRELEDMCIQFVTDFKLTGHIVMQVIVDAKGNFHIVECNPRFGGASTLSVSLGLDSFYWFFSEVKGRDVDVPFVRTEESKTMVRFPKDLVFEAIEVKE